MGALHLMCSPLNQRPAFSFLFFFFFFCPFLFLIESGTTHQQKLPLNVTRSWNWPSETLQCWTNKNQKRGCCAKSRLKQNDTERSRQQVAHLKAGFRTGRCNTEESNWRPKQNQIPGNAVDEQRREIKMQSKTSLPAVSGAVELSLNK